LLIVDEASGVMDEVFKAARGSLSTRGSIMVMTGNPTRLSGRFYDSHNAKRKLWHCLHWDSEESPNVDPLFSEEIRTEYGPESNEYKIRVRGDFPDSEESSLIPLDVIMTCVGKDLGDQFGHDLRYGVDVGWQGNDPSVIMKIRGRTTTDVIKRHKTLTTELVGLVIANINEDSPEAVNVDEIGVGAGVRDQLIEAFPEIVNGVNNAEKAMDSKKFANVRAESFWNLREMFFAGEISIPNDEDLIAQLTSIKYTYNSRGQIVIAPKDKMKAELGRSPDEADALALGHYHVESAVDAW
jgi:hypothetical protein